MILNQFGFSAWSQSHHTPPSRNHINIKYMKKTKRRENPRSSYHLHNLELLLLIGKRFLNEFKRKLFQGLSILHVQYYKTPQAPKSFWYILQNLTLWGSIIQEDTLPIKPSQPHKYSFEGFVKLPNAWDTLFTYRQFENPIPSRLRGCLIT